MKIRFMIALLPIFIWNCQKKEVKTATKGHNITGEWILDTVDMQPRLFRKYNFRFYNDGTCDNKDGFYLNVTPDRLNDKSDCSVYMGTKAFYRIKGDSLKISDNNGNDWMKFKFSSVGPEKMVLWGDSGYEQFSNVKFHFKKVVKPVAEQQHYDAIIVSRGPCYGSCPINGTYIDAKGNYFFNGVTFNSQNEFFVSNGNSKTFSEFENRFNRAGITKLKEGYSASMTCGDTNEVTFIKNGKIFKTISDYWSASPPDFRQAYEALSYKYQSLNVDYVYDEKFDHNIRFSRFMGKSTRYVLSDSEGFYLHVLLYKSKPTAIKFNPKYNLDYFYWGKSNDTVVKIETDGRYYRFITKEGQPKVFDLGFDFVERNKAQLEPYH
jgi:hypothetical protein